MTRLRQAVEKYPDIADLVDDVGRLNVRGDREAVGGRLPEKETTVNTAEPLLRTAFTFMRQPLLAHYRRIGRLEPGRRLPRMRIEINQTGGSCGDAEGWIEPNLAESCIWLPPRWKTEVADNGWGLLDCRFITSIIRRLQDGRPARVWAVAMLVESDTECVDPVTGFEHTLESFAVDRANLARLEAYAGPGGWTTHIWNISWVGVAEFEVDWSGRKPRLAPLLVAPQDLQPNVSWGVPVL